MSTLYLPTTLRFGMRTHLRTHMNEVLCKRYSPNNSGYWQVAKVALLMVTCKDCRKALLEQHPELAR